jgi:hypothetical protein
MAEGLWIHPATYVKTFGEPEFVEARRVIGGGVALVRWYRLPNGQLVQDPEAEPLPPGTQPFVALSQDSGEHREYAASQREISAADHLRRRYNADDYLNALRRQAEQTLHTANGRTHHAT